MGKKGATDEREEPGWVTTRVHLAVTDRGQAVEYDEGLYKKRGVIKRVFGKMKENRRLVVRYEKSDVCFLGFILVALVKMLLC